MYYFKKKSLKMYYFVGFFVLFNRVRNLLSYVREVTGEDINNFFRFSISFIFKLYKVK